MRDDWYKPAPWWPKRPTVIELIGRFGLTDSQRREVFDGHDAGDEDARARNYATYSKRPLFGGPR